ncbi:hypothetical protein LOC54_00645 [Acetobacter sp. AN02]|uniref:hypothetical protein n=1 Tax=Acetobacter sp. AN02 TaxID=2894186 RepID=UPI0024341CAD|nr:hypothetical protein [Acetobacter sp. AN02]MDG6093633.1 hypothetical protein [Acetobacter sp. AN02]
MRKETIFVIAFVLFTSVSALAIWSFAIPNFRPVTFPEITAGYIETGPMRHKRDLSAQEISIVNDWISQHKESWGPLTHTPPSSGDARLYLHGKLDGKDDDIVLTLWTGISAADWNNTIFVENPDGTHVHVRSVKDKEFTPLRRLADDGHYQRSAFP